MATAIEPQLQEQKNLASLFEPRSIAVVGASRRPEAVGHAVLKNLITAGFTGPVYPVNPKATEIEGLACYPSLSLIPHSIDLAILIVPSHETLDAIKACGEKKVKSVIIISAGFREVGPEGQALERQVKETARALGISFLGPNCLGLINTDPLYRMNASFGRTMPKSGNIAFISQSGALCTAILDYAKGQNLGFSKFVSLGNKSDLNEVHLLQYLKDDPETDVILMYLEDLQDGWSFIQVARELTGDAKKRKPIITIKSGRTAQGAKAAQSHTGSLMGSDEVYDAIFAQAGVLRAESVADMFNMAKAFA
jgi:acetyltransferase